jgi:4-amino-4-deoxy-L-arabinose transferase-like glycosyltransferase
MSAVAALAVLTLIRLLVTAVTPLSPDEAYYWVWSHALAAGYPDHPFMVALWIRAGTWLVGDTTLGVRLLGPFAAALGSLLLADAASRLMPWRYAGIAAAALLNSTLLFGAGVVLMTPDTPLLFFWVCALWALARLACGGGPAWWLAAGAFIGLALDSKYSAALLAIAVPVWMMWSPRLRTWFRHPAPWCGAALACLLFSPVLLWNAQHGWVSFLRQGGRVADWQPERAVRFLSELAAGQAGLATPLVFVLCIAGVVWAVRAAWRTRDPSPSLLAAVTLIPILVFVQHAFGDRVQGNWPAVIYPGAVIAACGLSGVFWRRLMAPAVVLGAAITGAAYLQASHPFLPLPPARDPVALQLSGWKRLAAEVEAAREAADAGFIAADQYGTAAELARLLPPETKVVAAGERWGLIALPSPSFPPHPGILVRTMKRAGAPDPALWHGATPIGEAMRSTSSGAAIETYRLYRIPAPPPGAVALPRPG